VKQILTKLPIRTHDGCQKFIHEKNAEVLASEICDLFKPESEEPKFNNVLEADAHNWDERELIKPDDNRLLSDEEFEEAGDCGMNFHTILLAQLAKDQLHEQTRIRQIFTEIEDSCPINLNRYDWYRNLKQREKIE